MPSRRHFLLGGAAVGAACLGGSALASSALALEPEPPTTATHQSPIDIVTSQVAPAPYAAPLVIDYPSRVSLDLKYISKDVAPDGCSVRQEDETVQGLNLSREATVTADGEVYRLLQFHFHTHSEHTVNGRFFPLEQHFVHQRVSDGKLLVLGVFLVGRGAAPQDRVLSRLPAECADPVRVDNVNLRGMLPANLHSYRYAGSLTTPTYDEGVRWHVMRQRVHVAGASIDAFQQLFPVGDFRPPQPLNGRRVRLVPGRLA